ncbi:hypothetical protein K2173_015145 [Erythroxylum novogranatense]|uniref:3'-5' exonuclease domain-containing protein n=1 Tax=Erythroxylum novogranatense TaxID=1862640 RepID=A0AAV8T2P2_9ROSI|nr:hypothetical protein K2173_015145 [Erythroxylum novogranatense]
METLRGPQITLNDGSTMVTEVVSDEDSHLCLYVLLQDMLKVGDMVVGFGVEWGFRGSPSRSGSSSGRNIEPYSHSSSHSDKTEQHPIPRRVEQHIAILTLCTKIGCVLIRLSPSTMSASLKRFLSIKDIIFAGVHIKEDLQKLKEVHGTVIRNVVDMSEMAARVYDQPRFAALSARDLANKILSTKFEQKPFAALWSNWFDQNLSSEQIECATIDAYAAYRIGRKLMESGSSSVKRLLF